MKKIKRFIKWIFISDGWGGGLREGWWITGVLFIICAVSALVIGALWLWVFPHNSCNPPYHLVYTGWHWALIGKVLVPVNDYACEA